MIGRSNLFSRKTRKLFQDSGEPQKQQITTNKISLLCIQACLFVLFLRFTPPYLIIDN